MRHHNKFHTLQNFRTPVILLPYMTHNTTQHTHSDMPTSLTYFISERSVSATAVVPTSEVQAPATLLLLNVGNHSNDTTFTPSFVKTGQNSTG